MKLKKLWVSKCTMLYRSKCRSFNTDYTDFNSSICMNLLDRKNIPGKIQKRKKNIVC